MAAGGSAPHPGGAAATPLPQGEREQGGGGEAGRFVDASGRVFVSVPNVPAKRRFLEACLAVWGEREGRRFWHLLRHARAVSVPEDVMDAARLRLRPEEGR